MSTELRPYPKYKESDQPWLELIPAHWNERRAKFLFREIDERSETGQEELLSVSHLTGVTPRSQKNITMFMAESYAGHKLCRPGDLVINTMWAWMAALGVSNHTGIVSPSYGVYRLKQPCTFIPGFLDHLLRTQPYVAEYVCRSTGIRSSRLRLYPEQFLDMPVGQPPIEEQEQIVAFLAAKDREIRRFIRAKRRMIELLNEQKQAIIQRAVTRGLDPDVRRKPSGVEWLGEVPEHWDEVTVRHVAESLQTGPFGSQLHAHEYVSGGIPIINPSHLRDGRIAPNADVAVNPETAERLSRHRLAPGDIVFARRGELGRCALVGDAEADWLCGTGCVRMRPISGSFDPDYLLLILSSKGIAEVLSLQSVGATMDNLNTSIVGRLRLPHPPILEQRKILAFVAHETSTIDNVIQRARREIDLIREYRTRLIADVVTGKLDVRGAKLPSLDTVDVTDEWEDDEEAELESDDVDTELAVVEVEV